MVKTFAGARLRRLREEHGVSQIELARQLAISPSYLNQIEHDSRPLTVAVLIRITEVFGVDTAYFAPHDTPRLVAQLREALPTRAALPDLTELATRLPEVAEAVIDLYRRYRQANDQLAEVVGDRELVAGRSPHDQVSDFFYRRQNYVPDLDEAAEALAAELGVRRGESRLALNDRLAQRHGIRIVRQDTDSLAGELHRYRPETRTLHLSTSLRAGQEAIRMGAQIALLEYADVIDEIIEEEKFDDLQTQILMRVGLANYFAAALILPYREFLAAAETLRYDIELLTDHFAMGWESICHRLSTLQRPKARGVPFSFVRVDRAGNMSKRQSATGFPFSRSGGTCPLWNVYEAFSAPGRVMTQIAAMPDGQRYLWIARTVTRHHGGYGQPGKVFAIGLGCETRHAGRLVYSAGMDLHATEAATPIGPGCKTCTRMTCPQRAAAPISRRLDLDENRSTFIPYPLKEQAT
ncbi:short-chain fatty acyl-CoA regulator family protein [Plantactinospora soyae]|uniref:Transcriptional regulator/DNA-binding XRE family transcriptional regulator n=1 Tax=Plantactinospora soyae TaxID=1544732 RepID=A0A927M878_9ACTN|nr:short-chain fatty acyl-CoA regulator family protein [Plantactinospora soyae]MBE1488391.1 putative transcriptional regulator/DNA-binding XRE family transcriptional regulator [Plantactinospora soyae]